MTNYYCKECHEKVYVEGFGKTYKKSIYEQYRIMEDLVTVEEIEHLMKLFDIGKGPLGIALGFGEIIIKR